MKQNSEAVMDAEVPLVKGQEAASSTAGPGEREAKVLMGKFLIASATLAASPGAPGRV